MKGITKNKDQLIAVSIVVSGAIFLISKFGVLNALFAMGIGYGFFFALFVAIAMISLATFGSKGHYIKASLTTRLLKGAIVGGIFVLLGIYLKDFLATVDFSSHETQLVTFFVGVWFVVFSPKMKEAFEEIIFKKSSRLSSGDSQSESE